MVEKIKEKKTANESISNNKRLSSYPQLSKLVIYRKMLWKIKHLPIDKKKLKKTKNIQE